MSQSIPTGYIPPGISRALAQKTCPGGLGFDFRKLLGGREFDKGRDYVENVSCLGLFGKMMMVPAFVFASLLEVDGAFSVICSSYVWLF